MVTKQKARDVLDAQGFVLVKGTFDWKCLSSDTKPTEGVYTNDLLMELDTGNKYYFDGSAWQTFGGGADNG